MLTTLTLDLMVLDIWLATFDNLFAFCINMSEQQQLCQTKLHFALTKIIISVVMTYLCHLHMFIAKKLQQSLS